MTLGGNNFNYIYIPENQLRNKRNFNLPFWRRL